MHPVKATFEYGCASACLESICIDNGIYFNQSDIVAKYIDEFPQWRDKPGLINYDDTFRLAQMVKLSKWGQLMWNPTKEYIVEKHGENDTVGIILAVHKFYDDDKNLFDTWHALRLDINDNQVKLMNPSTMGEQIKSYSWEDLQLFNPSLLVLKNSIPFNLINNK